MTTALVTGRNPPQNIAPPPQFKVGVLARIGHAAKAAALAFTGRGGQTFYGSRSLTVIFPTSARDMTDSTDPLWANSAVMACTAWIQRNYPSARLRVVKKGAEGTRTEQYGHPLTALYYRPNPYYSSDVLQQSIIFSILMDGNAYVHKVRDKLDRVKELWWLPHGNVEPQWPKSGKPFISHYLYRIDNSEYRVPVEDMIHFRFGVDPRNPRKGITPWVSALQEVDSDNESTTYVNAILRNFGVPGAILSPKDPNTTLDEDTRAAVEEWWRSSFTRDKRGKPMLASLSLDVAKLGLSPEDLSLDKIRVVPEDRICAVIGIAAMVVGLTSGAQSKTYANFREALASAWENCLIPLQKLLGAEWQHQLLGDETGGMGDYDTEEVDWDYSQVRVLQADIDKLWTRATVALQSGGITINEYRTIIGLPPRADGDKLMPPKISTGRDAASTQGGLDNPTEPSLPRGTSNQEKNSNGRAAEIG